VSSFIDHKYLNLLSSRLSLFKRKSRELYNFRCPICGDSKKNKYKSRGYAFVKDNSILYKCHNCGAAGNLKHLIDQLDPTLSKQYTFEKFKDRSNVRDHPEPVRMFKPPKFKNVDLKSLSLLSDDHPAVKYVTARRIPQERHSDLYYTECFKSWITTYDPELASRFIANDPRIIIPFFDRDKNLIAAQGRSITNNTFRYFTIKINKNSPKIFGLERWNSTSLAYITEGPFDSMFIPNCMAMAGSDLDDVDLFLGKNIVFVYDNERRNAEIHHKMLKALKRGFRVVVWPNDTCHKDINDMVVGGIDPSYILNIIESNTFEGLQARLRINQWKRT
jgi:hypothetical protein